jgi:hypothetical protein
MRTAQGRDGNDDLMLVDVVEVAESVEVVRVPALVRLNRVETFPYCFGYAAGDDRQLAPTAPRPRRSAQDGEGRAAAGLAAGEQDELVGKVVERRPEIVDRVPRDCSPKGIGGGRVVGSVDVPASLVMDFHGGFARAGRENTPERFVEFCCMEFRPIHLDLHAVEAGQLPMPLPLRRHPKLLSRPVAAHGTPERTSVPTR